MIDDAMVQAIIEISNNDKVAKIVEPNLMWHSKIEEWMIRRIFKSVELIQEVWNEFQCREQGDNRNDEHGGSKSVCKVSKKRNHKA